MTSIAATQAPDHPSDPVPAGPSARDRAVTYRLEDQVGYVLRRAHQRASEIFADVMIDHAITPTQFAALAKLHDIGPVSQNQLGRHTAMDPATIFGVVQRLTKRGFVAASPVVGDARMLLISLTPEGEEAIVRMKGIAAEVSRRTLAPLSPEEAETFLALLGRLA